MGARHLGARPRLDDHLRGSSKAAPSPCLSKARRGVPERDALAAPGDRGADRGSTDQADTLRDSSRVVVDSRAAPPSRGRSQDLMVARSSPQATLVVCPRNNLAIARMWPSGSSNGDSGPNRRNAPEINRQLVQETHR